MIADCGLNEFGGTTGGKHGDQTGGEYKVKPYYQMAWDGVLRYRGLNQNKVRNTFAAICTLAANNDNIGYDATYNENGRESYFRELKKVGYDPRKVKTPCAASCSSSTCGNIVATGYVLGIKKLKKVDPYLGTTVMVQNLRPVGFDWLTDPKYRTGESHLKPGDILLDQDTHATVYVGNGSYTKLNVGNISDADEEDNSNILTLDDGSNISLEQTIAKLYSSSNYSWVNVDKEEGSSRSASERISEAIRKAVEEKITEAAEDSWAPRLSEIIKEKVEQKEIEKRSKLEKTLIKGNLSSYPNVVQAPYIDLTLNGIRIGGYNNAADKYPNHITSLQIEKVNGRINNYTINLVYQVRAGEDPNMIDTLLSRTGYTNKIKIRYGDSAYGVYYREDEAYIMDVTHSDNVQSSVINYTIKATSSIKEVENAYFDFPGLTSKPSAEIIKMLYTNKETSNQLLRSLKGMANFGDIMKLNYIPTDDDEVYIPGLKESSLLERLYQLVSYMHDGSSPDSSYFLSFQDDAKNGSFFRINKVTPTKGNGTTVKNCYYIDVGYPGDSFVTNFSLNNDVYWPMYYKYADSIPEYSYDIDYTGRLIEKKVNPLIIDNKYHEINTRDMNWWDFVKNYPISATVTIKGLMAPVLLMENVYVYAQFYGKEDMASGLYSIIGQVDKIDGSGYTTTLELLRVSNI